jgi:hypothetical protein
MPYRDQKQRQHGRVQQQRAEQDAAQPVVAAVQIAHRGKTRGWRFAESRPGQYGLRPHPDMPAQGSAAAHARRGLPADRGAAAGRNAAINSTGMRAF